MTFQSQGNHSATDNLHLLHGVLPGEVVCTENLTPLLKLLPCKGKAGISSLFDGHKIFDAAWQSMSIDVQPKCSKGQEECQIGIEETVDVVLDIERSKRPRANPIPRPVPVEELECDQSKGYNSPDVCYPVATTLDKGWELSEVFGRKIPGSCPLTDQTKIVCLHVPDSREVLTSALAYEELEADGLSRCYSLPFEFPFDLELPPQDENTYVPLQKPTLYAERTIIGHGQERGGMRSILINPSPDKSLEFVYFESLPWFLRPYLHTLRATVTDNSGTVQNIALSDIVKDIFYRPAVDRHRGTQLELILSIPAASTVTLIYDFEKTILRYTEYPPDANRGFYVAPAVIRVLSEGDRPIYLRTTSLLLALPTPDFSMPYNVIILTSTVMALAFGSIFNMLVRRLVTADEAKAASIVPKLKSKLVVLKDKIRGKSTKTK